MTAENKIQAFANSFWKHASNTKGILSLEDAYINWSNNSGMTISEFGHVWARINDDVSTKFGLKKADISFSRTEDMLEFIKALQGVDIENLKEEDLESLVEGVPPKPELDTEPELGAPPETSPEINEKPDFGPPPEGGVGGPGLEEGGEEPDLKLTESLLL